MALSFENSDLDITYTHWKCEGKDKYFLFPPLSLNNKLLGVQSRNRVELSRIDFTLKEKADSLIFEDLHSGFRFMLDLSDVSIGKIHFSGHSGLKETWIRIPLEQTSVWM
ncbi:hypothetical protein FVB32_05460 [Flagellimonas hymeniacidonis]|uniref:Uncharacterized protein n=1 Tax=Flagellimonas hymeniacidonis TaxID=2603628 RepID=A0A5C8V7S8_9FLAO|nr:hypothetical protein [Flagellimonas hymeniacidonis]TXN37737.1 hypothetical protein FVB32_05460 [Flagellimonas hymeniacidonis]